MCSIGLYAVNPGMGLLSEWIRMLDLWHWRDIPFMDIGLKNIPYFGKDKFLVVINVPFSQMSRSGCWKGNAELSDPYCYKMHPILRFHRCWPAKSTLIDNLTQVAAKRNHIYHISGFRSLLQVKFTPLSPTFGNKHGRPTLVKAPGPGLLRTQRSTDARPWIIYSILWSKVLYSIMWSV